MEHARKAINKAYLSRLAGFIFACFILSFSASAAHSAIEGGENKTIVGTTFASLSGFKPGAIVSYKIYQSGGTVLNGQGMVNIQGQLSLSLPEGVNLTPDDLAYEFNVNEDSETLNFTLRNDKEQGTMSIEGDGASQLSEIHVDIGASQIDTKSDWAGLFKETGIKIPENIDEETDGIKVAFFSANPAMGFSALESPAIIKVQLAPGGGGPTSANVNTSFAATVCGISPFASFCNAGTIRAQSQGFVTNLVHPLQLMADQLTAVSMHATQQIGRFFDAKEQLEVQRDFQTLKAEAIKDYHPSEQMCRVGSLMKSVVSAQQKMAHEKLALNKVLNDQYQNKRNAGTKSGEISDIKSRLSQFRRVYCDPMDNDGGLYWICQHDQDNTLANSEMRADPPGGIGGPQQFRMNKDVEYMRTVEYPLTLNIDSVDPVVSEDEEDIAALAKNLFWTESFKTVEEKSINETKDKYLNARGLMALNNIAHNSFTHIVGMKAAAPLPENEAVVPGWAHMKTMMREFGLGDEDIAAMLGAQPSYYAQMDVLTKKLYQNPDFYTNLYDKPANVERITASMDAIGLMQLRDQYEGSLRKEMLLSAMIQESLFPRLNLLNATIRDLK